MRLNGVARTDRRCRIQIQPVVEPVGNAVIMRGDEKGGTVRFGLRCEQVQHLLCPLIIQAGSRFVGQQYRWAVHHRTGDGYTLPLPMREFVRVGVGFVSYIQVLEDFVDAGNVLWKTGHEGGQQQVLLHRKRGQEVQLLEHNADMASPETVERIAAQGREVFSGNHNMSLAWFEEPCKDVQKCGFTTTRLPQHEVVFTLCGIQVGELKDGGGSVLVTEIVEDKHGACASRRHRASRRSVCLVSKGTSPYISLPTRSRLC